MSDTETVHVQLPRRTAEKIRRTYDLSPDMQDMTGVLITLPPEDVNAVLYALTVLTPAQPDARKQAPPCP